MIWLRIIPAVALAVGVAACAKVAKDKKGASPLADLAGSEWGLPEGGDQFVGFKTGGEVAGNGGCNRFFGKYILVGGELKIGPLASTKKACPNLQDEQKFLSALKDTRAMTATHLKLTLLDENGATIMELQRRDWD